MRAALRALIATLVLAALTGLAYPLVMTGVAEVAFHGKAEGSLVDEGGHPVGSGLIGQAWTGPTWFYGRPSALSSPYDASTSGGSNLGPLSQPLADDIAARATAILAVERPYRPGVTEADIPVDLLTASGSGVDPDISPAAALFQAPRIAAVRGLPLAEVEGLIGRHVVGRTLGVLGEPRVSVLALNLALQRLSP